MIEKILYLMAGILTEVLITLYYIFVGNRLATRASVMTILITLLNFFIFERILINLDWIGIFFYAIGSAIGCFSIIKLSKKLKKKCQ